MIQRSPKIASKTSIKIVEKLRFPSIILLILLVVLVFSSCGNSSSQSEEEKILVIYSRLWSQPEEQEYLKEHILRPFEEEHNVKIRFKYYEDEELLRQIVRQNNNKNIVTDLVIIYASRIDDWIDTGFLAEMTTIKKSLKDRSFTKGVDEMLGEDSKEFVVPIGADVYLLCATKEAREYLPIDQDLTRLTWEDIAAWSRKAAEHPDGGGFVVTGISRKSLIYQLGSIILSYGGGFPDIASKEAEAAWEIISRLTYYDKNQEIGDIKKVFSSPGAYITVANSADVGKIVKLEPKRFVFSFVPQGPEGKGAIAGTSAFALLKGAPEEELAAQFIEYITRPDVQIQTAEGTGGFIPTVNGYNYDPAQDVEPERDVMFTAINMLEKGRLALIPSDFGANWKEVKLVYDKVFREIINTGTLPDKDVFIKAEEDINNLRVK